jgi:hypothetical protein
MGVPMELQPHPELRHHAEYLDFMLYQTQKDLDASRALSPHYSVRGLSVCQRGPKQTAQDRLDRPGGDALC